MCNQEIAANGWTAMPANAGAIFGDQPFINKPSSLTLSEIKFPFDDPLVAKTLKYAKETLHVETFNHSMRVYFYGRFTDQHTWSPQHQNFYLTSI
jgi:cyanamide hydratase